tara:strand:+ start:138 stop:527 length:390 start_codon:yes stop_codon:yes gene_type:complete
MATVADAITALIPDEQWVMRGEPTTEAEFNSMFRRIIGADENNFAVESDNPDNWGVSWATVSAMKAVMDAAEPMKLLREERNRRIAETDWWALADLTMSQAQWDYRQALRDITKSYSSLDDVVWPTKPE